MSPKSQGIAHSVTDFLFHRGAKYIIPVSYTHLLQFISRSNLSPETAYFGGIKSCRFRGKVAPGDKLKLETKIIKCKGPVGVGHAVASVDGKVVADAELTFMIG